MTERRWPARLIRRYVLLQVPALVVLVLILVLIRRWVNLPSWLIWCIAALWIAKDVILFPFVWRAYDWDRLGKENSMVGLRGIAKERLTSRGYVLVRGELWQAEVIGDGPPIQAGEGVLVRGMRGLTLLVEPDKNENGTAHDL